MGDRKTLVDFFDSFQDAGYVLGILSDGYFQEENEEKVHFEVNFANCVS